MLISNPQNGDLVKIQSPVTPHVHNEYCHCGEVVLLLERASIKRNRDITYSKKISNINEIAQAYQKSLTAWWVWNEHVGVYKLYEDWMVEVQ